LRGGFLKQPRRNNFVGQGFEARIAVEIVKHRIGPNQRDILTGALAVGSFLSSIARSLSSKARYIKAKL
jgi:hypothetical protein